MSELWFVVGPFLTLHIKCEESLWEFLHLSWHVRRCILWRPYSDTLFLRFHEYIFPGLYRWHYLTSDNMFLWVGNHFAPSSMMFSGPLTTFYSRYICWGWPWLSVLCIWWIVSFFDDLCWKREVSLMTGENYSWILAPPHKKSI